MSQENAEIVRRLFAETGRGNFSVAELFDPGVRIGWLGAVGMEPESMGLESVGQTIRSWITTFERIEMNAERIVDAGDQVAVIAAWRGRGKASGVTTEWRFGTVLTLRDGKVISVDSYEDPADALAAVGLSE